MTPPRALLFDFDGVIADTENVHVAAWQRVFESMGWEVADEVCARAAEVDDHAFLAEVFAARGILDGDVEGWSLRKQELTLAMLADSPRVYPGVAELVARVPGTVRLAVVTTTWRANVIAVLKASGLSPSFALVVAKEDVTKFKPDPEGYVRALKSLGLTGAEAVAIEDSPGGLASASGAGVRTLAVGHRRPRGEWSGDSPFVNDLRKTDEVLTALGLYLGSE